jgi:hypothetical protein
MEWLLDPTVWVGLLTLVILEIVLGIDNLIFIAILADKLPPAERERARWRAASAAVASGGWGHLGRVELIEELESYADAVRGMAADEDVPAEPFITMRDPRAMRH